MENIIPRNILLLDHGLVRLLVSAEHEGWRRKEDKERLSAWVSCLEDRER